MLAPQGYRASLLHFFRDPRGQTTPGAYQYWEDGLLLVDSSGIVQEAGPARSLLRKLPRGIPVTEHPGCLIVPGFVDCHVHFPQIDMIASYGDHLLDWLDRHAYPAEEAFKNKIHARSAAGFFLRELLRNGTTTALVFATVHPESVDALFETALPLRLRLISGKTLMDRNAPKNLLDGPTGYYELSRKLIARWHGKGRFSYALTPRFAPTSSGRQLKALRRLKQEFPDTYVHTHLSENVEEVKWVKRLFPGSRNYLDVYDRHELAGPKSVFAHCLHLTDPEWKRLTESGAAIAACPTSNLFLGSGLFDWSRASSGRLRVGLGTDIGAGTSFSLLRTLDEAYKTAQLQNQRLTPLDAFYLATLGGAKALSLDDKIGNFMPGHEADFTVLDLNATPLLARRMRSARQPPEKLFLLSTLGDDRCVRATYVLGRRVHSLPPRHSRV